MQTIHLPDTTPEDGPERVSLTALARRSSCSPTLARVAPQAAGGRRGRTTAGGFQSCV